MMKRFLSNVKHKILTIIRVLFGVDIPYLKWHYAQEGEDCILEEIFAGRKEGFYVDIGAHHPFGYSNTWKFYKKGWRGINIDATPGSMQLFKKFRPGDINLEIPVAGERKKMQFYMYREPALNGFLDEKTLNENRRKGWELLESLELEALPLGGILDQYMPEGTSITLMSIDIEGLELAVLKSNDWKKYRPEMLIVEMSGTDLEQVLSHPVTEFLVSLGYKPTVKTLRNVFFESLPETRDEVEPPAPDTHKNLHQD